MAKVDNAEEYIGAHKEWKEELETLRIFLISFPFEETIKWGAPVYTYQQKNVVGLVAFKTHYALWFFNGAQLQDNTALLHNAQKGKTKTLRQIRFTKNSAPETSVLRPYVLEAIELVKEGKVSKPGITEEVTMTPEFQNFLQEKERLESAFHCLSPGKQREYIGYISEAKKEETREKRFEKIAPLILEGKGLNDKYKK